MINSMMYTEITEQPEAIALGLPSFRQQIQSMRLKHTHLDRIVFVGSGDSYFAPLALELACYRNLQVPVSIWYSGDAATYRSFRPSDLVIPISVSGQSAATLAAAQTARLQGSSLLAITGSGDSQLAQLAHHTLVFNFHSRSRQTPHTVDYMSTLLAIAVIIEHLAETPLTFLDNLGERVDAVLTATQRVAAKIAGEIGDQDHFFFLGSGPDFGCAQYAAAKFWEAGGLWALPFELQEFAHGGHLLLEPGAPIIVVTSSAAAQHRLAQRLQSLTAIGGRPIVVVEHSSVIEDAWTIATHYSGGEWSPFFTALPLQWLCLYVANAKGIDLLTSEGRQRTATGYRKLQAAWN